MSGMMRGVACSVLRHSRVRANKPFMNGRLGKTAALSSTTTLSALGIDKATGITKPVRMQVRVPMLLLSGTQVVYVWSDIQPVRTGALVTYRVLSFCRYPSYKCFMILYDPKTRATLSSFVGISLPVVAPMLRHHDSTRLLYSTVKVHSLRRAVCQSSRTLHSRSVHGTLLGGARCSGAT